MADQGEQVPQVPAGENLEAAQAVAVAQPPLPPPPQNQEEPANPNPGQNAAGEQVTLEALQERIKFLENAKGTSVQALINRITYYGSRRLEDFDKYEAVRLAEELFSVAKTTGRAKAASYDIIATTLGEKILVSKEQFKAYFLALLADKEFTRIFDAISKVDKSFTRPAPLINGTRLSVPNLKQA